MNSRLGLTLVVVVAVCIWGSVARSAEPATPKGLPKLLDLGADKCVPCKMMAPVLEGLRKDYAGSLAVEFIDVWKTPTEGKPYKIKLIPTQIFFDASGKELFRHEGFMARDDILARWKALDVELTLAPASTNNNVSPTPSGADGKPSGSSREGAQPKRAPKSQ